MAAILVGCAVVRPETKVTKKETTPAIPVVDPAIRLEDYPVVSYKRTVGDYWLYVREAEKSRGWDSKLIEIRKGEGPAGRLMYLNLEAAPSFGSDFLQIPDWKGAPLVGIRTWTGGNHCCTGIVLLHLSDPVNVVTRIEFKKYDDSPFYVQQRGSNLVAELPVETKMTRCEATTDHPYEEFPNSYCASLIIGPDGYRLDTTGLRKHHEDLDAVAQSIRQAWRSNKERSEPECDNPIPPTELWQTLYRLAYTGAGDDCWPLIERVWPEHYPGKETYWEGIMDGFKASPYWEDIRKLNGWK